jgi:hypothetical protein
MELRANHPALVCVPELLQVWKNLLDDWSNSWFVMADFFPDVVIPKAPKKYRPELEKLSHRIQLIGNDPMPILPNWTGEREVARVLSGDVNSKYIDAEKKISLNLTNMTEFQWFRQESQVTQGVREQDITLIPRKNGYSKNTIVRYTQEIMHTCEDKTLAQWRGDKDRKFIRPGHVRMQYQHLSKELPPHLPRGNGGWHCTLKTGYYVGRCDKCFKWYCSEPPTKDQIQLDFYDFELKKEARNLASRIDSLLATEAEMKRFILFACGEYEGACGWNDFQDSFGTKKKAIEAAVLLRTKAMYRWWNVLDTKTWEVVAQDEDFPE